MEKWTARKKTCLARFGSVDGPENAGILFVQVKNAVAQEWFAAAGKSLADVQNQINTSGTPESFAFPANLQISLNVNIETTRATVSNVLAYLPGKTDEYIIIGAHYDHLGRGYYGSLAPAQIGQFHPGADDNGSGTAGVLELARLLAPMKGKLQRGILFASFAGEELGLLGSADWVKEPTLPLDKAVAMINMDMIGRIKDDKVYIGGVGTGTELQVVAGAASRRNSRSRSSIPPAATPPAITRLLSRRRFRCFSFSRGCTQTITSLPTRGRRSTLHDAARLLDFIDDVTLKLDDAQERTAFVTVVEDHAGDHTTSGGGGGYGPYFGSIPDFGQEEENGVKFSDVRPGSPAAKAGFKAGDVLVEFGAAPIKNLYDFTDALRRSKIGDEVEVKVLRDGKPITATVKLEQRK